MYFRSDMQKLWGSPIVRVTLGVLLLIAVADPLSVYWQAAAYPGFFTQMGKDPYQYWLLINSVGWGNQAYQTLFWLFPVLLTGLGYHSERSTSLRVLLTVRGSRRAYFGAKLASAFLFTFLSFGSLLLLNLAVTWAVFPADAAPTAQYRFVIPADGTFAAGIYAVSPFLLAVTYVLLNALAAAVCSVIALASHAVFPVRSRLIAVVGPAAAFYAVTFLLDAAPGLLTCDLRMVIQPRAACGLASAITAGDLLLAFSGWLLAAAVLSLLGARAQRDLL